MYMSQVFTIMGFVVGSYLKHGI